MFQSVLRLLTGVVRRAVHRRGHSAPTATAKLGTQRFAFSGGAVVRPRTVADRRVPYGERPARNRQLTLLAELLGEGWRREIHGRVGVDPDELTRRQAATEILRITGGRRPEQVARSTWHRAAVDPDWVDRPRGARRRSLRRTAPGSHAAESEPERSADAALPIQVKAVRLLGERLGLDVSHESQSRFGTELVSLDRRTAAAWIAELTQQVLMAPERASAA